MPKLVAMAMQRAAKGMKRSEVVQFPAAGVAINIRSVGVGTFCNMDRLLNNPLVLDGGIRRRCDKSSLRR